MTQRIYVYIYRQKNASGAEKRPDAFFVLPVCNNSQKICRLRLVLFKRHKFQFYLYNYSYSLNFRQSLIFCIVVRRVGTSGSLNTFSIMPIS